MSDKLKPENEGERSPARRHDEKVQDHVRYDKPDDAADDTAEDVDGPEGEELGKAQTGGKRRVAEEDPEVDAARENDDRGAVRGED